MGVWRHIRESTAGSVPSFCPKCQVDALVKDLQIMTVHEEVLSFCLSYALWTRRMFTLNECKSGDFRAQVWPGAKALPHSQHKVHTKNSIRRIFMKRCVRLVHPGRMHSWDACFTGTRWIFLIVQSGVSLPALAVVFSLLSPSKATQSLKCKELIFSQPAAGGGAGGWGGWSGEWDGVVREN